MNLFFNTFFILFKFIYRIKLLYMWCRFRLVFEFFYNDLPHISYLYELKITRLTMTHKNRLCTNIYNSSSIFHQIQIQSRSRPENKKYTLLTAKTTIVKTINTTHPNPTNRYPMTPKTKIVQRHTLVPSAALQFVELTANLRVCRRR